ncbi:MAG: S1 family peptidase [Gemmatimonadota bacterium]|nr:S1 family peptidase [Gemmatimonadota bacterium]MDH3422576.1 S1 family peptidase [Gemmatimonadota bacterium]
MKTIRILRSRTALVLALLADLLVYAGTPGPYDYTQASLEIALAAQNVFTDEWLSLDEVVGTAIGVDGSGHAVLKVYLAEPGYLSFPRYMGGVEIVTEVTGRFTALPAAAAADPTTSFPRPVPIGVSTGHPDVTAGTIGARVTDGERTFALSNNHIFAANNGGQEGDNLLQPGIVDGGRDPDDAFGTLYDFEPLHFCRLGACDPNRVDAAIALTTPEELASETPEGGYGSPRPWTAEAALGMAVQKYGRTTGLTVGEISGIHATLDVDYRDGTARFEDQIVISGRGFSAGGDSGSLIVTKGMLLSDRRPVGLLFAGSPTTTLANPIDHVFERFGIQVDGN